MEDCIFCKIVNKEIETSLIFEDENFIIFPSKFPVAKTHWLFVPKRHLRSMQEVEQADQQMLGELMYLASKTAKDHGLLDYKLMFNVGKYAQVPHLHLHLLAGDLEDKT